MMCASNMPAFIPPVAPSSSAAERFGPSHHTLGNGTLAAMFFLKFHHLLRRAPSRARTHALERTPHILHCLFMLEICCPVAHFAAKFYAHGFARRLASDIMKRIHRPGSHSAVRGEIAWRSKHAPRVRNLTPASIKA